MERNFMNNFLPWERKISLRQSTFSGKLRVLGLTGKGEERERQMAVAVGILVEIVLMILLSSVEVLQGQLLYG